MEMHKKTREMIYSIVTNITMSLSKLHVTLENVQSQLKIDKVSVLAKDAMIKILEDLVRKLGYDPSNIDVVEELVNKKNLDIAALRKQLKLPATVDPLAKDIEEIETQKVDMMKLIMEQITQLKKMETKMEKLIKEKDKVFTKTIVHFEALPITTIPTTISATTSIGDVADQLANVVKSMSL